MWSSESLQLRGKSDSEIHNVIEDTLWEAAVSGPGDGCCVRSARAPGTGRRISAEACGDISGAGVRRIRFGSVGETRTGS